MANVNTGKNLRAKEAKGRVMDTLMDTLMFMEAVKVGGDFDYVVPVVNKEGITTYVSLTLTAKNDQTYEKDGEVVLPAYTPEAAIAKYNEDQQIKQAQKEARAAELAEFKRIKEEAAKKAKAAILAAKETAK